MSPPAAARPPAARPSPCLSGRQRPLDVGCRLSPCAPLRVATITCCSNGVRPVLPGTPSRGQRLLPLLVTAAVSADGRSRAPGPRCPPVSAVALHLQSPQLLSRLFSSRHPQGGRPSEHWRAAPDVGGSMTAPLQVSSPSATGQLFQLALFVRLLPEGAPLWRSISTVRAIFLAHQGTLSAPTSPSAAGRPPRATAAPVRGAGIISFFNILMCCVKVL